MLTKSFIADFKCREETLHVQPQNSLINWMSCYFSNPIQMLTRKYLRRWMANHFFQAHWFHCVNWTDLNTFSPSQYINWHSVSSTTFTMAPQRSSKEVLKILTVEKLKLLTANNNKKQTTANTIYHINSTGWKCSRLNFLYKDFITRKIEARCIPFLMCFPPPLRKTH